MAAHPGTTAEEWFEGMRRGAPLTPDDVTITSAAPAEPTRVKP